MKKRISASTTLTINPAGENAVNVTISPQTVIANTSKEGTQTFNVYVDLYDGSERIPYADSSKGNFTCGFLTASASDTALTADGKVHWSFGQTSDKRFYYRIIFAEGAVIDKEVPFKAYYKGNPYDCLLRITTVSDGVAGDPGERGSRGPSIRGPQNWDDLPYGYAFQSGAEGEEFLDVVIYRTEFYYCDTSHAKSSFNSPKDDRGETRAPYWRLGTDLDMVATKILLASYALVKNLGVECIDMRDSSGNILFQAKDGNVTCRTGTFENVVFSGLMRKKKTTVTSANFSQYFTLNSTSTGYNWNLDKLGTWIDLRYLPSNGVSIFPTGLRSIVGNNILVYNNSGKSFTFAANCTEKFDGGPVAGSLKSYTILSGQFVSLDCRLGVYATHETPYFILQKGSIDTTITD